MEILDLFTAFPGRAFSMSEIMRATNINVASCHAVLNALTGRGYLFKRDKNYLLGSALIAVGQAAAAAQPLITRAQAAAHALNVELDVAVLLSTLAGDDILALTSLPDTAGRRPSIRVGQRMPLVPPAGVHFLAWASDETIARWIERGASDDPEEIAYWRHALALTRQRGFQVTLSSPRTAAFAALMQTMAAGTQPLEYKTRASNLITHHGWTFAQPERIEPEQNYPAAFIAAPIFDHAGRALLSLGLGGFDEVLSGAQINFYANRVMETCLQVMREERAATQPAQAG
jgi:DNA-binding IclR family transcriptional regulator